MGLGIKRVLLLLLLLQIGMQTRANFYYFLQHKDQKAYRINTETKYLERYEGNRKWLPLKAVLFDSSILNNIPKNININNIPSLIPIRFILVPTVPISFMYWILKPWFLIEWMKLFIEGIIATRIGFFEMGCFIQ